MFDIIKYLHYSFWTHYLHFLPPCHINNDSITLIVAYLVRQSFNYYALFTPIKTKFQQMKHRIQLAKKYYSCERVKGWFQKHGTRKVLKRICHISKKNYVIIQIPLSLKNSRKQDHMRRTLMTRKLELHNIQYRERWYLIYTQN